MREVVAPSSRFRAILSSSQSEDSSVILVGRSGHSYAGRLIRLDSSTVAIAIKGLPSGETNYITINTSDIESITHPFEGIA
jgi:hypothetical protein